MLNDLPSWSSRTAASVFALALLVALAMHGCGGSRSSDRTTSNAHDNAWFCQTATQEGWECVQDSSLVANPRSDRIPPTPPNDANVPPMARTAPEMTPATPAVAPAIAANVRTAPIRSPDRPPAAQSEPSPRATPSDQDRPAYQRLAYKPDRPMKLSELPAAFFAVQLVALTSKQALEEFVNSRHLVGMSAARIAKEQKIYYVLLLGVYPDAKSAELAAADRPPPLRDLSPWIRPLGTLQKAMRAADTLAGGTEF